MCVGACQGMKCTNDCDCVAGGLGCAGGFCMVLDRNNMCCTNPFCPQGQFCINPDGSGSTCPSQPDGGPRLDSGPVVPDASTPDGAPIADAAAPLPIGSACTGQDCGPGEFCIDANQGLPGGYCSQDCGPRGSPCPMGSACHDVGMGNSICLEECVHPSDCRMGYQCVQLGIDPFKTCWPIPPTSMNPMGAPVGSACSMDQDCLAGLQCLQFMGSFPGGYCTKTYCDAMNACPSGSECYAFPGLFSLCLADCPSGGSQSTCRMGYYCLGPTGRSGVCTSAM
jgi:hypothetical protein